MVIVLGLSSNMIDEISENGRRMTLELNDQNLTNIMNTSIGRELRTFPLECWWISPHESAFIRGIWVSRMELCWWTSWGWADWTGGRDGTGMEMASWCPESGIIMVSLPYRFLTVLMMGMLLLLGRFRCSNETSETGHAEETSTTDLNSIIYFRYIRSFWEKNCRKSHALSMGKASSSSQREARRRKDQRGRSYGVGHLKTPERRVSTAH